MNRAAANIWVACGYNAGVFLYGKDAVDTHKVYMMRNAIDLQCFQKNDEIRQMIRKNTDSAMGCASAILADFPPPKNHFFVLEIFDAIRKIAPKAKFLLVGDGELRDGILAKIKRIAAGRFDCAHR